MPAYVIQKDLHLGSCLALRHIQHPLSSFQVRSEAEIPEVNTTAIKRIREQIFKAFVDMIFLIFTIIMNISYQSYGFKDYPLLGLNMVKKLIDCPEFIFKYVKFP